MLLYRSAAEHFLDSNDLFVHTHTHTHTYIYIYTYIYCKLKYIGETSRNLHVCLKKLKRDIRIGTLNNALFQHISQSNHNFDFNSAKMFIYIHNKRIRRIFEAAAITLFISLNTRPGFYNISPYLSKSILNRPKHYCIVWNEPLQALDSMSMHRKLNLCALIRKATSPH